MPHKRQLEALRVPRPEDRQLSENQARHVYGVAGEFLASLRHWGI
jgi:hypothetical protein